MYTYHDTASLQTYLDALRGEHKTIGFAPTMGALHAGHFTLLEMARRECDCCVVSIFVNPTQFNEVSDLEKYPRPIEEDILALHAHGCCVAFVPSVEDVYPEGQSEDSPIDFLGLDSRMEGAFRPGHFAGVGQVMDRLLSIVKPDRLYMGQKDFQQTAVVKRMMKVRGHNAHFVTCPTVREADGLAMSSRNRLLTPENREAAPVIYQTLEWLRAEILEGNGDLRGLEHEGLQRMNVSGLNPEYLEIADGLTLEPIHDMSNHDQVVACCAVWAGEVRLIDNILIGE